VKVYPNRNKHPRSTQGVYFRSHTRLANQHVNINHGLPIDVPNHRLYFLHAQRHVQIRQGLPIDVPNHLFYFLYMLHCVQKAKGSRSTLRTTSITFSTCIIAYKKQWAPNRCSMQLLLLLARASPCTQSKGLPRYVLQI
jgi:hypothetical protein